MATATERLKAQTGREGTAEQFSDEALMLDYRRTQDPAVFAQLVERYEHPLYNYLRRYLANAEMAEDVFQATFLRVHLKCREFEPQRKFRPWLYTIATNQAIDAQRRSKRHRMLSLDGGSGRDDDASKLADLLISSEPLPEFTADVQESGQWLQGALGELPDYLRIVVELVYYQGLKYRETAEALSIPVGTVKSRMHAAVLKLNEAWRQAHQEQE
jgi:RNA polymerase sigma-70 factor (ECF subfamily)